MRREKKGYSLLQAASESGISISTIQRIEFGRGGHVVKYNDYLKWLGGSLRVRWGND
jgi:transcriptional regulator with XRE-family HTH domain